MTRHLRALYLLIFFMICNSIYAADNFFGKFLILIKNQTPYQATINPGGNNNWSCGDFCFTQVLKPHETQLFESMPHIPPFALGGIQGINIGYGKVNGHVEFWLNHSYSTTINVIRGKSPYDQFGVGTDTPRIKTALYVAGTARNTGFLENSTGLIVLTLTTSG